MAAELSIPVLWTADDGPVLPGRLDVHPAGLHLDGGSRGDPHSLDVPFAAIASIRIGRADADRVNGRRAVVLELDDERRVSFVGFDRPGALHELVHHVERRLHETASAGLA